MAQAQEGVGRVGRSSRRRGGGDCGNSSGVIMDVMDMSWWWHYILFLFMGHKWFEHGRAVRRHMCYLMDSEQTHLLTDALGTGAYHPKGYCAPIKTLPTQHYYLAVITLLLNSLIVNMFIEGFVWMFDCWLRRAIEAIFTTSHHGLWSNPQPEGCV
jgi:hypothetical protein